MKDIPSGPHPEPFDRTAWARLESDGIPIYVCSACPDWFVPNRAGDEILIRRAEGEPPAGRLARARFLARLPQLPTEAYPGRAAVLSTDQLPEIWFHLTNRCNLQCSHCLCSSSPREDAALGAERVLSLAAQARALGARIFALTGGEPFVHPEFPAIIDHLLDYAEAHVVVLTNALLLPRHAEGLARWPGNRLHLQISLDGSEAQHDRIRGAGSFAALAEVLRWLREGGRTFTLSMCVTRENVADMPALVEHAAESGATHVHFMWYFVHGRGDAGGFASPECIYPHLLAAAARAETLGVRIDNLDALRTQLFAPRRTVHDGTGSGWESVAVGPDGRLYPSPALIGVDALATEIGASLATAWRESDVLERLRRATVRDLAHPLRFLLGGGDSDHSYLHAGTFMGDDPYQVLHERLALWLIAQRARSEPDDGPPGLRLRMGDRIESCGAHGSVALVHTNCLLALADKSSRSIVKEFYAAAAEAPTPEILNPVTLPEPYVVHIPEEFRRRSYGCGSPVLDAGLQAGDRVVDLGSGSGVECFVAARIVGPRGRVVGVDMLDAMLDLARRGAERVVERMGFDNLDFRKGYLEALPLKDDSADVVMSNCVINLAVDKRATYREVWRVLRPGGRLIVSDVVCREEPGPGLRNDERLRGECIAGAQTEVDLFAMLEETGFTGARIVKRFPYRVVGGHPFFALTYEARRPAAADLVEVMYKGPFAGVVTSGGTLLWPGRAARVTRDQIEGCEEQVLEFDDAGNVLGLSGESGCACCAPAESAREAPGASRDQARAAHAPRHRSGCMVCGRPLVYRPDETAVACTYCGGEEQTRARCEAGHFVCDACHARDALEIIESVCAGTHETDMIALMELIRSHDGIPIHGPEHHAMVPGIILATYRNLGGALPREAIRTGIARGAKVPGGVCGFNGVCGAAEGAGIAFSLILDSNPVKAEPRRAVMSATQAILAEIAKHAGARCCQRDCWLALRKAAELSRELLPVALLAETPLACVQSEQNPECAAKTCPLLRQSALREPRASSSWQTRSQPG